MTEWERIKKLSPEALDQELRDLGFDPDLVGKRGLLVVHCIQHKLLEGELKKAKARIKELEGESE